MGDSSCHSWWVVGAGVHVLVLYARFGEWLVRILSQIEHNVEKVDHGDISLGSYVQSEFVEVGKQLLPYILCFLEAQKTPYTITWKIKKRTKSYSPRTHSCNLCLWEKVFISKADKDTLLNSRSQFLSKCVHKIHKTLSKFK